MLEISTDLEEKFLRGIKDDAKFDFLKLVYVSDSTHVPTNCLQMEITQSAGTQRFTKTSVETITKDSEFVFDMAVAENVPWILSNLGLERLTEWLLVEKLLEASYLRSKEILEEEARYFSNDSHIRNLIADLQGQNQVKSPLLRLGAGQGFLSTTVDLQIKRRDAQLYDEAIREGVSLVRKWNTQVGNFPKTRRVVLDTQNKPRSLLGWVKLTLEERS